MSQSRDPCGLLFTAVSALLVGVVPVWAMADESEDESRDQAEQSSEAVTLPAPEAEVSPMSVVPAGATHDLDAELASILATPVETWVAMMMARRVEDTPASVVAFSAAQIENYGYRSLSEVLEHVLGFYVIDDHILADVAVRGVSGGLFGESGMLKVMINGRSVAFHTTGGNWIGPELVPLSVVERIEILRGPASSLYGADAFLGAINVVTRKGADLHGGDLRVRGGVVGANFGAFDVDVAAGSSRQNWDYLVSARVVREDLSGMTLPSTSPAPSISATQSTPYETHDQISTSGVVYARITRNFSENTSLTLSPYVSAFDRGAELASWAQLTHDTGASHDGTQIALQQSSLSLAGRTKPNESLELDLDATYFRGAPLARDRIVIGSDLYEAERHFSFQGLEATAQAKWTLSKQWLVSGGASATHDREMQPWSQQVLLHDVGSLDAGTMTAALDPEYHSLMSSAGFGQVAWTPGALSSTVVAGLRYDYHNIYGQQLSGRLAASAHLLDNLGAKIMFGRAFKAPSAMLLYGEPLKVGDVIGNPALRAQRINTFEMEINYAPHSTLKLRTSGCVNLLDNVAEFTLISANQVAQNVASVRGYSWESRVDFQPSWYSTYFQVEVVRNYRSGTELGYRAELLGVDYGVSPTFRGFFGLAGELPGLPLSFASEAVYVGRRRASDTNIMQAHRVYWLDPYVTVDASLTWRHLHLFGDLETKLQLTGRNLINATGPMPGYAGIDYPLTPRTFFVAVMQLL